MPHASLRVAPHAASSRITVHRPSFAAPDDAVPQGEQIHGEAPALQPGHLQARRFFREKERNLSSGCSQTRASVGATLDARGRLTGSAPPPPVPRQVSQVQHREAGALGVLQVHARRAAEASVAGGRRRVSGKPRQALGASRRRRDCRNAERLRPHPRAAAAQPRAAPDFAP